jgi:hypothetical protein
MFILAALLIALLLGAWAAVWAQSFMADWGIKGNTWEFLGENLSDEPVEPVPDLVFSFDEPEPEEERDEVIEGLAELGIIVTNIEHTPGQKVGMLVDGTIDKYRLYKQKVLYFFSPRKEIEEMDLNFASLANPLS